ncbi:MAG: hypothetical protein IJ341_02395 [Bacteroidales bacterium]|nr:hypothetical protein [Bacteroidales bacterium]
MNNLNGTCPHICPYKESSGYCRHTVCVNPLYQFEKLHSSNHTVNSDLTVLSTYCIGSQCERASECARFVGNAPIGITVNVIDYFSYGSCSVDSNGIVNQKWDCGAMGNWKMFIQKSKIL